MRVPRGGARPLLVLGAVAVAWVVAQLLITFRMGIGWDETVYLSQYAHGMVPGEFSAPRSRGVPLIVAPIVAFTTAAPAIRLYLTLLSGVLLFVSFWPWLRLRPGYTVPVAAGLFASVWVAMFYGNEAMPDMFVAYGAVAVVALFLLAVRPGRHRAATVGVAAVMAGVGLVRPTDSLWITAAVVVAGVVVRPWRRPGPLAALVAGEVIGWGEWFVEAFWYFGGPVARLRAAAAENETGLHFSLVRTITALSQSATLCRPDCTTVFAPVAVWFFAIPAAAVLGCVVARGRPQFGPLVLATVTALTFAGGYIIGVGYAAPRFLLPAYALAAIPVAEAVCWLATGVRGRARPFAIAVVAVGVVANLLLQARGLRQVLEQGPARAVVAAVGTQLAQHGVASPCVVTGTASAQVAFYARCGSENASRFGGTRPSARIVAALARRQMVVVQTRSSALPAPYLADWREVTIVEQGQIWRFYVSPPRAGGR